MSFHVVIPARFASSRLPGKPLAKIGGVNMIEHVCQRAAESGAESVTVATDYLEIKNCVEKAGYKAVMTDTSHLSGSDRVNQACQMLNFANDDIIVNLQGDEPFIASQSIGQVAELVDGKKVKMATLCCPIDDVAELNNANVVKVVFDCQHKAVYFSRSCIPFAVQSNEPDFIVSNHFKHIGIYAYTRSFLKELTTWPRSHLEISESLEQLRVIENGQAIYVAVLNEKPLAGVDTEKDLEAARAYFAENN